MYRKYKEGQSSIVEFLRGADGVIGTQTLLHSMLAQRSLCTEDRTNTQSGCSRTIGEIGGKFLMTVEKERHFGRATMNVADENGSTAVPSPSNFANTDVYKEADDVLAIAGINTDDEARLMLQVQSPQLERVANDAMNKLKSTWRKSIELCVFARVYAMNKASSCGEALHIDRQVFGYLEEALQVRLKNFISRVLTCAARRTGSQQITFDGSKKILEPKQQIRKLNVDAERSKNERLEKERQALLKFGETVLIKRKRTFENCRLEEKVAKVRQEEEERIRADVANKAARSALGEAKYQKWYDMAQTKDDSSSKLADLPSKNSHGVEEDPLINELITTSQALETTNRHTHSITIRDCREALFADMREAALRLN